MSNRPQAKPRSPVRDWVLAQALRVIRDSSGTYTTNVATRALEECGIEDPPEEPHP